MKFRSNPDKLWAEILQPTAEHFRIHLLFDSKVDLAYTSLADWTSVAIAQFEDTLINERFSSNHSNSEPVANKGEACEILPRSIPS
jgi:hypothetical protein